jgi:dTDP-4-dehydrorhamnose reductase
VNSAVAVTGATGRLGGALVRAIAARGMPVVSAGRGDLDLDDPQVASRFVAESDFRMVVHCAAWTDVDACAREPSLAMRRNGEAAGELAEASVANGRQMVLVSTNEVFDGRRDDAVGYDEDDEPRPINAYGASKLKGEELARSAFARAARSDDLAIVRTSWLFGPPTPDFPARIVAAADRLPDDEPLPVVADEFGCPTYAADLADAIVQLCLEQRACGTWHLVNDGVASRLDYARAVLSASRPGRQIRPVSRADYARASTPPAWGVLSARRARERGVTMRDWRAALADYLTEAGRTTR